MGVVVYESLTGANPHLLGKRDVLDVIQTMERSDLPRLSNIDPEFADLIAALTSRFPSRRPRNAQDAIAWFEPIHYRLSNP